MQSSISYNDKVDVLNIVTYFARPDTLIAGNVLFPLNPQYNYLIPLIGIVVFDVLGVLTITLYLFYHKKVSVNLRE